MPPLSSKQHQTLPLGSFMRWEKHASMPKHGCHPKSSTKACPQSLSKARHPVAARERDIRLSPQGGKFKWLLFIWVCREQSPSLNVGQAPSHRREAPWESLNNHQRSGLWFTALLENHPSHHVCFSSFLGINGICPPPCLLGLHFHTHQAHMLHGSLLEAEKYL